MVKNFPDATSEKILVEMDEVIKGKLHEITIHTATNNVINNIYLLNNAEKNS